MTCFEFSEFVSWFLHQAKCDAPLTLNDPVFLKAVWWTGPSVFQYILFLILSSNFLCCIWNFLLVWGAGIWLFFVVIVLWDRQILLFPAYFSTYFSEKWWILSCLSTAVKYLYQVGLWWGQYTCRKPSSQQKNTFIQFKPGFKPTLFNKCRFLCRPSYSIQLRHVFHCPELKREEIGFSLISNVYRIYLKLHT